MHPSAPALEPHAWSRRVAAALVLLAAAASQLACSSLGAKLPSVTDVVTPYRIDILQGNVVTSEQAQALQPGMSRLQVRDLLGSPLLTSVFHADRWDYVFTFKRQGQEPQRRKLTVFFKGEALERIEADALPSEAEFVASLDVRKTPGKAPVLQATEEQLKDFQQRNAVSAAAPTPVTAPTTVYPPLEAGAAR
ncbi:MAG: outer membrane protein assembly factor BamE [Comamonadaceae bacterium]|nr:outer membrane protein assembly factor BamE [Comamonadaceae bacterium]